MDEAIRRVVLTDDGEILCYDAELTDINCYYLVPCGAMESLRAELADKDKRIEGLEQTLENVLHGRREFIDHFKEKPVLITTEQIDKAWKHHDEFDTMSVAAFAELGITACGECEDHPATGVLRAECHAPAAAATVGHAAHSKRLGVSDECD